MNRVRDLALCHPRPYSWLRVFVRLVAVWALLALSGNFHVHAMVWAMVISLGLLAVLWLAARKSSP